MTPQSAKGKGRRLQQWVCARISEITGYPWGGNAEDRPIESRPMGQSGTDIRMESHVLKLFPFSIECKNHEIWNLNQFIEQSQCNLLPNTNWLLVVKRNNDKPYVVIEQTVLMSIMNEEQKKEVHFRHYTCRTLHMQKWIADTKIKAKRWSKDKWVIFFRYGYDPYFAFLPAEDFFNLYDKADLKRTK